MTTLPEITTAFLSLSDPDRILLLDYLADAGGIDLDTQSAALEWVRAKCSDEDLAASLADNIVPQGVCYRDEMHAHKVRRDARLEHMLSASERRIAA